MKVDITNNYKPPKIYEYMFDVDKNEYYVNFSMLSSYYMHTVYLVDFGLVIGGVGKRKYIKKSQYKEVFRNICEIISRMVENNDLLRSFYFKFEDEKLYNLFLKYVRRFFRGKKFNVEYNENGLELLVSKKPYNAMRVLGFELGEEDVDITVWKLPKIRKKRIEVFDIKTKLDREDIDDEAVKDILFYDEDNVVNYGSIDYVLHGSKQDYLENYIEVVSRAMNDDLNDILMKYKDSFEKYTGTDYKDLTDFSRGRKEFLFKKSYIIFSDIIKAFEEIKPIRKSVVVYRYLQDNKFLKELKVGEELVIPHPVSTTVGKFADFPQIMRIFVPKGSKIIPIKDVSSIEDEFEILLTPGSVLKLIAEPKVIEKDYILYDMLYLGNVRKEVKRKVEEAYKKYEEIMESIEDGAYFEGSFRGYVYKVENTFVIRSTEEFGSIYYINNSDIIFDGMVYNDKKDRYNLKVWEFSNFPGVLDKKYAYFVVKPNEKYGLANQLKLIEYNRKSGYVKFLNEVKMELEEYYTDEFLQDRMLLIVEPRFFTITKVDGRVFEYLMKKDGQFYRIGEITGWYAGYVKEIDKIMVVEKKEYKLFDSGKELEDYLEEAGYGRVVTVFTYGKYKYERYNSVENFGKFIHNKLKENDEIVCCSDDGRMAMFNNLILKYAKKYNKLFGEYVKEQLRGGDMKDEDIKFLILINR